MKTRDKILNYVQQYISEHGYSPTVREIGEAVGLFSSSTVHGHLTRLVELGLISKEDGKPRTARAKHPISVVSIRNSVPTMIEWEGRKYKLVE